ncbi:MAG: hypothetical protein ACYDIA_22600 [Candidatus Humimicrobiaceae bacterium]
MARFSRLKTLTTMIDVGVIPVFYIPDVEIAKGIVSALYEGGALAMTTPGDTSMASLKEIEKIVGGGGARVDR